ncbi:GNAT family N-acetyltransferase [Cohnella zeiphila]|uniref:GNAT family N-acetyltransferase n=1 Tax=Cohnella zeiphila TaxID=2761120 RepID=A0A7X0VZE2_9BACL|nr:GNAT family N-acetyltransferase [Cohnella zeiphila]MBB6735640.1 GNAT family N-acetyltransferase [Cohnella zeiphila]
MEMKHEMPGAREFAEWRTAAGLGTTSEAAAGEALARSLFAVTARDEDGRLIGMGRIVGDGSLYNRIVDVGALPSQRGEGLEETVLKELLSFLGRTVPPDAELTVLADVVSIPFYQKHGFRLIYPDLYGMARIRMETEESR